MVKGDRLVGHDYPGIRSSGFIQYELDELELGARASMAIDDPEQGWWETVGRQRLTEDGLLE
jgi:hypothetical protein